MAQKKLPSPHRTPPLGVPDRWCVIGGGRIGLEVPVVKRCRGVGRVGLGERDRGGCEGGRDMGGALATVEREREAWGIKEMVFFTVGRPPCTAIYGGHEAMRWRWREWRRRA